MTLELHGIAEAMGASGTVPATRVAGWSVDTRTQNPGDVYFALRGPNFDGHAFVGAALQQRAAAVVIERREAAAGPEGLVVRATLEALQDAGRWARGHWGGQVVGV